MNLRNTVLIIVGILLATVATAKSRPSDIHRNVVRGALQLAQHRLANDINDSIGRHLVDFVLVVAPDNDDALILLSMLEDNEPIDAPLSPTSNADYASVLITHGTRYLNSRRERTRLRGLLFLALADTIMTNNQKAQRELKKAKGSGIDVRLRRLLDAYPSGSLPKIPPPPDDASDGSTPAPDTAIRQPSDPLADGLVLHYDFASNERETIRDASPQRHNGTAYNGRWTSAGAIGGGFDFGREGYISIIDPTSTIRRLKMGSVAYWIKFRGRPKGQVISLGHYMHNAAFMLGAEDGHIAFRYTRGSTDTYRGRQRDRAPLNEWIHVAFVVDRTGHRLYLNGKPAEVSYSVGTAAESRFFATDHFIRDHIEIGRLKRRNKPSQYVKGRIDDIRIYRRPLTGDDVQQLYQLRTDTSR